VSRYFLIKTPAFAVALGCLEIIFVHFMAKLFFTSKAGCSENCLNFKMPKIDELVKSQNIPKPAL